MKGLCGWEWGSPSYVAWMRYSEVVYLLGNSEFFFLGSTWESRILLLHLA